MNWITNYVRPKLNYFRQRKEMPENLWIKCPETGEMVFHKDLEANLGVIPNSGYHMRITAKERLDKFFDEGAYEVMPAVEVAIDPLKFRDQRKYTDRLRDAKAKTGMDDAVLAGRGLINGAEMVVLVQDFNFMGGSLGMAAGEGIIAAMELAASEKLPFVLFAASGGARMQEGIISLMQLPRTTVAVSRMKEAGIPYIVVMTNPTTGGVTASYAMLGDIHIAEPGALIGFAGPRVIEQTIREKLPDGFQRSEYLQEHGMVDMVVTRHELKSVISNLVSLLLKRPPVVLALPAADESLVEADVDEVEVAEVTPANNQENSQDA